MPLYRNALTGLKCNVISEGSSEWEFQRTKSLKLHFWELVMAKSVTCYGRLSWNDFNAYLKLEKMCNIAKLGNVGEPICKIICRLSPGETYMYNSFLGWIPRITENHESCFCSQTQRVHFWRFDRPLSGVLSQNFWPFTFD